MERDDEAPQLELAFFFFFLMGTVVRSALAPKRTTRQWQVFAPATSTPNCSTRKPAAGAASNRAATASSPDNVSIEGIIRVEF